ncbi:NAD-dependent epimerase/dehydratase family protein [Stackebrandtia nassauensis]|uniref:NAD-dependent epimerase/dehydratase n=1 Tax=Stackebrandtia nassauensis (strain DSM 44728 / CIP 108903 / NRRL B-16338 / NBRC 102104 / LLR-40K-21) TaxID=446470 RepID=D3Q9G1_STANL|nr:NAD-dependent epimerase/dehydratase family protein [Stackebrandtia nassauensis]ADD42643.1 NAD-dependent epimerase/dehydratase [Stackebrandtia nassauensis DSM 44728]
MRILVLGGTVFLSKAVAVQAMERGHDVTVAARGESGQPPQGARFVKLDRDNPGEGLAALSRETFDAVVDVARIPAQVKAVLAALADRVGHWSFVSTVNVYADNSIPGQHPGNGKLNDPIDEDSTDPDIEVYGASKVACENLVRSAVGDKAFIARPGLIIGPGDPGYRFGYWPDRLAEAGEVLAPGDPQRLVQWIDVRDHAEWIIDAAENQVVGTFDAVCPPVPFQRFLDGVAEGMGTTPEFTWVDQDFVQAHEINPWSGEQSLPMWLPLPEYAGMLTHDVTASVAAGMRNRPVAESAADWYASMKDKPRDPQKGLTRAREAEVLAAWHGRDKS